MQIGPGELYSVAAAAMWAVGVVLYKRLGESLSPVALNLLKNLIVVGLMLPTVVLVHGFAWPEFSGHGIAIAALSGFLGIAVADTLYFKALNTIGAGRMGVVGNLFSPFVIVLSFFFLDERLSLLQFLGFALVMGGVWMAHQRRAAAAGEGADAAPVDHAIWRRGLLLGVSAILLNAVGIVLVKPVLETQPFFWVALVRLCAALLPILWMWHLLPAHHRVADWRKVPWRLLIVAAFFGQYLSMLLWLAGYRYTSASVASILNETASIFILVFAWLMLKEPLGRRQVGAVLLTFGGVAVMLL